MGDTCNIVRCDSCDFCYSSPYVAGDKDFYTLAFQRDHYPKWKWEHQMSYDVLTQRQKPFRLLELGAGDGAFIKRITPALTPKEQVLATEFSAYGSQQITDHGVRCLSQDIRGFSTTEPDTKFDAICLFQVLEHSDRLGRAICRIQRPNQHWRGPLHCRSLRGNGGTLRGQWRPTGHASEPHRTLEQTMLRIAWETLALGNYRPQDR